MRFAYAEPPYPGQAKRLYGDHPDYAGEVDHAALIARLEDEFDGWALSTSAPGLQQVLPLCPPLAADCRVCVWSRASRTFKPARAQWCWEPLIVRTPRWRGSDYVRDLVFACDPRGFLGGTITGQKPPQFVRWMLLLLGIEPDDEFVDLFPGSGAVGREWEAFRGQLAFNISEPDPALVLALSGQVPL